MFRNQRTGFTLIEMLVVMLIIVVLAALLLPVMMKAFDKANQTTCLNNQRQIAQAILIKVQDNHEMLPDANVWSTLKLGPKVLICPSRRKLDNGYAYNGLIAGKALSIFIDPKDVLLTADAKAEKNIAMLENDLDRRHDRTVIGSYLDGHVTHNNLNTDDLHYIGEPIANIDDLYTQFGIQLLAHPLRCIKGEDYRQSWIKAQLANLLPEFSLYKPYMLRRSIKRGAPSIWNRIILLHSHTDAGDYISDYNEDNTAPEVLWYSHYHYIDRVPPPHIPKYLDFMQAPTYNEINYLRIYRHKPLPTDKQISTFDVFLYGFEVPDSWAPPQRADIPNVETYSKNMQRVALHAMIYASMESLGYFPVDDSEWGKLNPPGFKYFCETHVPTETYEHGNVGLSDHENQIQHSSQSEENDSVLVAQSSYCCPDMDKTNIFTLLMTDPDYLEARGKLHPVIKAKTELMKKRLQATFPDMDSNYWAFVSRVIRMRGTPQNYTNVKSGNSGSVNISHYSAPTGDDFVPTSDLRTKP